VPILKSVVILGEIAVMLCVQRRLVC